MTGGIDRTIRIWDREGFRVMRRSCVHPATVHAVAFGPRGVHVASGCDDGRIRIFDARTGEHCRGVQVHKGRIWGVRFLPDGRSVLSVSGDGTAAETLVASGRVVRRWSVGRDRVFAIAIARDGMTFATGHGNGALVLWSRKAGRLRKLPSHRAEVRAVAFHPSCPLLFSTDALGGICVTSLETGRTVQALPRAHNRAVNALAISADGRTLVTGSNDRRICLWDIDTQ